MDINLQIQGIKSQIDNIKLQLENIEMQNNVPMMMNPIGDQLLNLSIQILNTGIQTFNIGKDNSMNFDIYYGKLQIILDKIHKMIYSYNNGDLHKQILQQQMMQQQMMQQQMMQQQMMQQQMMQQKDVDSYKVNIVFQNIPYLKIVNLAVEPNMTVKELCYKFNEEIYSRDARLKNTKYYLLRNALTIDTNSLKTVAEYFRLVELNNSSTPTIVITFVPYDSK